MFLKLQNFSYKIVLTGSEPAIFTINNLQLSHLIKYDHIFLRDFKNILVINN